MRAGLYKDVVAERTKFFYLYHISSILRWFLMILQLLVGAALTAIGSMSVKDSLPITILGAINTVVAGLLALLSNSGLPDRYRYDMFQYSEVEDHIKEILEAGVAPEDKTAEQVIAECFDMFKEAKSTVAANLPANYTSRQALMGARRNGAVGSQAQVKIPGLTLGKQKVSKKASDTK